MTRLATIICLAAILLDTSIGLCQTARRPPQPDHLLEPPEPIARLDPPANSDRLPSPRNQVQDEEVPQPSGLTLAEAERIALTSNPAIAQAAAQLYAAEGNAVQVGLPPNPTLGYAGEEMGAFGLAGKQGIFVRQTIVRGHKLKLDREVALRERARAEENLHAWRLRVLTDVRITFLDVLIAQQARDISRELLSVAEQSSRAAKVMFDSKEVSKVDVLRAGIETQRATIALSNAQNRYRAAWREFAAVLGRPAMQTVELDGQAEDLVCERSWDEALQHLLNASPQLGAAYAEIERARWALRRALVENVPNVQLQLGAAYDYESRDPIGSVQVGFPIPVLNKNQGRIRQARHQVVAAEANYQRLELSLQQRLARVYEQFENARQQVERFREELLPAAEESLELVRLGYDNGELDFLALLNAQQTYAESQLQYIGAQRELRRTSIQIDGMLLSGSLRTN